MLKRWKILEREDVSPSTWYPIERHTVELHNGKVIDDYYVATFGESAMVVPIHRDGRFVMVKQYKHGVQDVVIEFPAGGCDKRTATAAAVAELEEESGVKVAESDLTFLGKLAHSTSKSESICNVFYVEDVTINSIQNFDHNEDIEVIFATREEIYTFIQDGQIVGADTIAALHLYDIFKE